ncbi:MAG: coproporphyrinogen dehydrogenase HemZ [Clostridiales bacterium]|nr:coproporphyrinogen dehydrogenase HemZ [Clostridiales bacterium]
MKITTNETWLEQEIFDLIHLFMQETKLDDEKPFVKFFMELDAQKLYKKFIIEFVDETKELEELSEIEKYKNELEKKRYIKRSVKSTLYKLLSEKFNKKLPWGCLTGIRPTKVAYELIESGVDKYFVREALEDKFFVSRDKAKLVARTLNNQKCIIKNDKLVDLYINIPFCPTKCSYCSFISAEYAVVEKIIPDYIECLIKEIRAVKQIMRDTACIVKTIYIGGGTPTVLSAEQLEKILSELAFDVSEFTVECGRPDTITKEKLDVLHKYGVTRISINPQTFVNKTLKVIGRNHTTNDLIQAYMLALPYNFNVNMDLIAGLPGETMRNFKHTMKTVLELAPDNITIHTLALKKGSKLAEENAVNENEITEQMVSYGQELLIENKYKPYYMYKLKNQNAGLENVGFYMNRPCVFNIDSMEETATIFACGANAISKRIYNLENRIERQANVKFAIDYIARIDEIIEKKKELFSKFY